MGDTEGNGPRKATRTKSHGTKRAMRKTLTMSEYVDAVDSEVLGPLLEEHDMEPSERRRRMQDTRQCLQQVARYLRVVTQRRDQFRRSVLRLVDQSFDSPPTLRVPDMDASDPSSIDRWNENEEEQNQMIFNFLEGYVSSLELQVKKLEGELTFSSQDKVVRTCWKTDTAGRKVYVETEEPPPCQENFIHVSKQDMMVIIKVLKHHRKATGVTNGRNPSLHNAGETMKEHIINISDQVDRVKERLQQTTARIGELERERGTVLATLGARDHGPGGQPLHEVVATYIGDISEDKENLETELSSLRKQYERLLQEHQEVVEKLQPKTVESIKDQGRPKTPARKASNIANPIARQPSFSSSASNTTRSRRISAPVGPSNGVRNGHVAVTPTLLTPSLSSPRTRSGKTRRVSTTVKASS